MLDYEKAFAESIPINTANPIIAKKANPTKNPPQYPAEIPSHPKNQTPPKPKTQRNRPTKPRSKIAAMIPPPLTETFK